MKNLYLAAGLALSFVLAFGHAHAQERKHSFKFEQLKSEWRSPNNYRTASGAPGHAYWQQQADYDINIVLDDVARAITGSETITYTNHSPDVLTYLWLQLDQNVRAKDSDTHKTNMSRMQEDMHEWFVKQILPPTFEGGFKISYVRRADSGTELPYTINKTMMMVELPQPLKPGDSFSFSIGWSYNINDRLELGGRSGYEYFAQDDNCLYTIAQFYPRMCVYNDEAGWQNKQFLGRGEFTLGFGKFRVSITVPSDHIVGATGRLLNPEEVLTAEQRERLAAAATASDPVIIATQAEAVAREGQRAKTQKTWIFEADSVRDFAFATSRKFIWDAMGVEIAGRTVMAMSYYPKEGNPLWEKYSTRAVAHTLRVYSKYTFDYPYHKAISVHSDRIGMEYPMICFNFGRPNADGSYSAREKNGMLMVIIHEVGHNFFPMIVNSDERQWTWMDEGLNSFMQYLAEKEWKELYEPDYEYDAGEPWQIVDYMRMDKTMLSPIMTNSEQIQNFGPNAYSKPATALNILRETVMGRELFDRAFREYAVRWKFKQPTPEDFFRTMEDASAVDLDWFWRGWFYSVDHCDIGLEDMAWYRWEEKEQSEKPKKKRKKDDGDLEPTTEGKDFRSFYSYLSDEEQMKLVQGLNFYELTFVNKGGLVMPLIVEFRYTDGTSERVQLPAEIWRRNDERVTRVFALQKEVQSVYLDPQNQTADTDMSNNMWPRETVPTKHEEMKQQGGR
jgi:hypothetical protein